MHLTKNRRRLASLAGAAVVTAALGLAGTPAGAAPAEQSRAAAQTALSVVTWTVTADWGCDGTITGTFNQAFNSDHSWTSSPFVHSGRWFQVGATIVWTFADAPNLVYSGNMSGTFMT